MRKLVPAPCPTLRCDVAGAQMLPCHLLPSSGRLSRWSTILPEPPLPAARPLQSRRCMAWPKAASGWSTPITICIQDLQQGRNGGAYFNARGPQPTRGRSTLAAAQRTLAQAETSARWVDRSRVTSAKDSAGACSLKATLWQKEQSRVGGLLWRNHRP